MVRCGKALLLLGLLLSCALSGCDSVDDQRLPAFPVRITFRTQAEWDIHGVPGAGTYKYFIKSQRIPANFPYSALDETGYGGILLVCDVTGEVHALDLSCPVESRPDVRIQVPKGELYAECPMCGSTYEVFANVGMPRSGMAAQQGYALTRYHVRYGGAGEFMVITR